MKKLLIYQQGSFAGVLEEREEGKYQFDYADQYHGEPVSLTMRDEKKTYHFDHFPAFLEGLLPEGELLEALLRKCKIDRSNYLKQIQTVGRDVVGSLEVFPASS